MGKCESSTTKEMSSLPFKIKTIPDWPENTVLVVGPIERPRPGTPDGLQPDGTIVATLRTEFGTYRMQASAVLLKNLKT